MKLIILLYSCFSVISCEQSGILTINNSIKTIVNNKFLSVALDTVVVAENFKKFDMKDEKLINLVSYLSPGYLRVGGNMADTLHFSKDFQKLENANFDGVPMDGGECAYEEKFERCFKKFRNFTMTGDEWVQINVFANNVGLELVFDLNCLIRNENGSWNSENAEELISFSHENGFNIHWQLGNEPDAFKHVFNYEVNATQLAKDFSQLRSILNGYTRYKHSLLIGPDTTRPRPEHLSSAKYLKEFLLGSQQHILDAISFHQYYLNGRISTVDDFLNPETFYLLEDQLELATKIVKEAGFENTHIWLGETSTAYGGGAPGLSNTFAGTFLWLDKLGLSAKFGLQTVIRQSLFRGYYALINDDYSPTPDWWLSILYKKFIGPEVIDCTSQNFTTTVRLYCHCGKMVKESKISVFGINLSNTTQYVNIQGVNNSQTAELFILTAPTLTSNNILLNGEELTLNKNGNLPNFTGRTININKPTEMPPYSLVFWMIPAGNITVCIPASVNYV